MFDEVLEDNPQITISDSLIKLVQEKQGKIERLTFRHFLEIKKLTKPGKQEKLRLIIHGMFRRQPPGADGGPPPRDDMPPPPPNDF